MLIQPLNEVSLVLQLKAVSPLLIKEGRYTETEKDKWSDDVFQDRAEGLEDAEARRRLKKQIQALFPSSIPISRNSLDEIEAAVKHDNRLDMANGLRFYLPGSSIRGAWRSYLERWLRGLAPEDPRVCDPFQDKASEPFYSCSHYLGQRKTPVPVYANSCPVCRLFGNTGQGSRIAISDAERKANSGRLVSREHININRHNQQVKTPPGPFKFFALQDAEFVLDVKVRNFELMQVGLIAEATKALCEKRIWLGSGKNKGYGAMELTGFGAKLTHFGTGNPGRELRGIGELPWCTPAIRERYKLVAATPVALPNNAEWKAETQWRWSVEVDHNQFTQVSDEVLKQVEGMWPNVAKLADRPREATA